MNFKDLTQDINLDNNNQRLINAKKVAKWEKTGLLEGLAPDSKTRMARLLENQAKALLEASDTSDIRGFQAIAFPLVRRVFGRLLAQEIVSVQPMALPSGLIFWLDFTFGRNNKAGTGRDDWMGGNSVFGDPLAPLTGGTQGVGGHYFMHNSYSQREASASVALASSGSATWDEVDFDPELSGAVALGQLFKVTVDLDDNASITNVDVANFKSFAVSGTVNSTVNAYYRRHNKFNTATNVLTVYHSGSQRLNSGSTVQVAYVKKTALAANTTGTTLTPAFEYGYDNSDDIPTLDIKIASMAVTANDRKLKVQWTPELAQDLNAYHAIDAEQELTQMLADQVALDIDNEVLRDLTNEAELRGTKMYWDMRPNFFVDKNTGHRLADAPTFTGNLIDWYHGLLQTIQDVSNQIARKTLQSGANFLVVGPDVATILETMVQFRPIMDASDPAYVKFAMGIEKMGSLSNRWTVYKNAHYDRNKILVGLKGDEWLKTGYVYAPYVPMIVTPTIYDPNNFTPSKALMTRYARQIVRPDFYGVVVVKGMQFN